MSIPYGSVGRSEQVFDAVPTPQNQVDVLGVVYSLASYVVTIAMAFVLFYVLFGVVTRLFGMEAQ